MPVLYTTRSVVKSFFPVCSHSFLFQQSVTQFELINYSEYGTVVDGVLYLSAHCDSNQTSHGSSSLTSNHVKALGQGPRARYHDSEFFGYSIG